MNPTATAHIGRRKEPRTLQRRPQASNRSSSFSAPVERELKPERHRSSSHQGLELQREALVALRARLRGNVAQTADTALAASIETTSASPDTADRASETIEQDLALSLLGSASATLDQIEAALQRIEDGTYGYCADCGTKIPAPRLEAIPYATCCVDCATRQERSS